ncbi:MAG: acyltransferase [Verrucomicrobiales bacterium]
MSRFENWKAPEIRHNEMTCYNWLVQYPDGFVLGHGSDIGAFTYINARRGVDIGAGAQIGSHCSLYSVSTIDGKEGKIVIGENSCIGSHSTVMPGVTIGRNAVVGAHSFVNCDIPDGAMAYGIPARVRRR